MFIGFDPVIRMTGLESWCGLCREEEGTKSDKASTDEKNNTGSTDVEGRCTGLARHGAWSKVR